MVSKGKRNHYKGYKCRKLTNNRNVEYEYKEPPPYLTAEEKKKINLADADAVWKKGAGIVKKK